MKSLTIAGLALLVGGSALRDFESSPGPQEDRLRTVFYAVLEGLYEDGVSTEDVKIILKTDGKGNRCHFIPGCPLCVPALEAFRVYAKRPPFVSFKIPTDTWGPGLGEDLLRRLRSDDLKTRLDVIQGLISKWVGRRLDSFRLTAEERNEWTKIMKEGMKQGNEMLRSMAGREDSPKITEIGSCAICEGATAGAAGR